MPRLIASAVMAVLLITVFASAGGNAPAIAQGPEPEVAAVAGTVIVDELSDGFRRTGSGWRSAAGGYDGHHYWTPASRKLNRVGIWTATLGEPGLYRVLAKLPAVRASTRKAVYKLQTASGWVTRVRSQAAYRGRWVNLGTHAFTSQAEVRLTDRTRDPRGMRRKVAFDAIKFVPVEPPEPPVIERLDVDPKHDRAIVTFSLAEAGPAKTEYRETGSSAWTVGANETSSKYADHRQVITGLQAETSYELRVIATNLGGETISPITRFRTTAVPPPVIRDVSVAPEDTRAVVTFSLGEKGPGRTEYRESGDATWTLGAEEASSKYADHRQIIRGLVPQTDYQLRITATNEGGKTISPTVDFTTKPRSVDCTAGEDLQQAINRARSGDTIVISGTCQGNYYAEKALILRGTDGAKIRGPGSGTVLTVGYPDPGTTSPVAVEVKGLTIAGGTVGILVTEPTIATLDRLIVEGHGQAGIKLESFSDTTLTGSTISGNGVGIRNDHATLTVNDSTIADNGTSGIENHQQGSIRLVDSLVEGNGGRGIDNLNAGLLLVRSTVRGNAGGGIYNDPMSYLTVRDSTISGNRTATQGGGIYIADPRSIASGGVVIEDSSISGNVAGGAGGGIYRETPTDRGDRTDFLSRVTIRGNVAGTSGGGIWNGSAPLSLSDVRFDDNTPDDCVGC
jgi:hypothetical protein